MTLYISGSETGCGAGGNHPPSDLPLGRRGLGVGRGAGGGLCPGREEGEGLARALQAARGPHRGQGGRPRRPAPQLPFIQLRADPLAITPGLDFFPHLKKKSVGEGEGNRKGAPLWSGKGELLHLEREREKERGREGRGEKERQRQREMGGSGRQRVRGSTVNAWRTHLSPPTLAEKAARNPSLLSSSVLHAQWEGCSAICSTLRRLLAVTGQGSVLLKIQEGPEARFTHVQGVEGRNQALSASGGSG